MPTSVFTLFPNLPGELRNQIWQESLPSSKIIKPTFYFFKKGCWKSGVKQHNQLQPSNFDLDLLEDVQFRLPQLFVNHEARSIALSWIQKHDIRFRTLKNDGAVNPVFVRLFNAARDALYVPSERYHDFQNDVLGIQANQAFTRYVAIPESMIRTDFMDLEITMLFYRIEVLFIIFKSKEPDLQKNKRNSIDEKLEFQTETGNPLFWVNHDNFDFSDCEPLTRGSQYWIDTMMETNGVRSCIERGEIESFRIERIYAHRT